MSLDPDRWQVLPLIAAALLPLLVVMMSGSYFDAFHEVNPRSFDGVMYEYRQLKIFDSFAGDYSVISRWNRSINQLVETPNDGLYNAILCLVSPMSLMTGTGNLIRSIVALSFLLYAVVFWLRGKVHSMGIVLVLVSICSFPALYSPLFGLASYMPDIPAVLFLTSGVLLIVSYRNSPDRLFYLLMAMVCFTAAVGSRLNTFIYAGALFFGCLPLLVGAFHRHWLAGRKWRCRFHLVLVLTFIFLLSYYVAVRFSWFSDYYNSRAYGYEPLQRSVSISLDFFKAHGILGFLVLLQVPFIVFLFRLPDSEQPRWGQWWAFICAMLPFVLVYGIPVVLKRLPNNPHVLNSAYSVMAVFLVALTLLILPRISGRRCCGHVRPLAVLVSFALFVSVLAGLAGTGMRSQESSPTNRPTAVLMEFLEKEFTHGASGRPLSFLAFYDDLVHIPVQVHFRRRHGIPMQDVPTVMTKTNLMSCESTEGCLSQYLGLLREVDVVAVNDPDGIGSRVLSDKEIAREVSNGIYGYMLSYPSGFDEMMRFETPYHGEVVIFKRLGMDSHSQ